ncbi:MAG: hypothetical protein HC764_26510 [Pleurocapsa sp. CRU_1_2]|nr:hypothetical protein [Pleurocapsa sp. CRU_1_2]
MVINGSITFLPDGMTASMDDATLAGMVAANSQTNCIPFTGKLPAYTPPSGGGQRKFGGGKSYGLSPDEKMTFLKKQMASDLTGKSTATAESSLPFLITEINHEPYEEGTLETYFDLLIACIK